MVLGHFHEPDVLIVNDVGYTNSGTWTPMIDVRNKLESENRFSVVMVETDSKGSIKKPYLRQWNPCTDKLEQIVLIESLSS